MIFALYCISAWELYLKNFGNPFAKLLFDMPKVLLKPYDDLS
jgi:hypothetical protein